MFKRSCDNCKKAIKNDYASVDFRIESRFGRHDFCVSCIKSIPVFLRKVMKKSSKK
ncbi:MAG: hypothetical protein UX89_C0022G0002 [Parcubacteria group bacterium GW2011_GWA2_47_16]|nr:MAG: hypothetical protein UX89_C0022G0002 [Parcubacteria group bacterium GW2011_GWA2_47_16]